MATVRDILAVKGPNVLTVSPHATVLDAALRMNDHKVGSVVVVEHGRVVGIFTERDILRRIVAEQRDPATTLVEEVMTAEVACALPDTTVEECRGVMKNRRIRHLPVVDETRTLRGLISIGDLNAHETTAQEVTIHFLHEYLYGAT
jgi:CBS domain-containing protein